MENQNKSNGDLGKYIQNGISVILIAMILGAYSKMNDLNDRMIRIEERAIINTENINKVQASLDDIKSEQKRCSDRLTRLEFKIGFNDSK